MEGGNDKIGGGKGSNVLETRNRRSPINEVESCKIGMKRGTNTEESRMEREIDCHGAWRKGSNYPIGWIEGILGRG